MKTPYPTRQLILRGAICLVALSACSPAWAQSDDRPPPEPLFEREDAPDHEQVARAPASTGDESGAYGLDWPALTPSVMLTSHMELTDPEVYYPGVGIWLGANYYPWPDTYNTFWSAGVKVESSQQLQGGRRVDVIPTVRSGFAWVRGDAARFDRRLLANLQIYGLAGWRIARRDHPARARAGIGVSSPRLSPATAYMLLYGVPLPNAIELVVDASPDLAAWDLLVQIGIGL